jgi:NurA-like 5'-3' nuclease
MSGLTDKELDALDDIQTAMKNGEDAEDLSPENMKILEIMANSMGYSLDDWLSFDEEKQLKIMNNFQERTKLSNSGFADIHRRIKPDGKVEYYRNQYIINNPETGDADVIAFNPYYT